MTRKKMREDWNYYMGSVSRAARHLCRDGGIYAGREGAERFAREVGYAVEDYAKIGDDAVRGSYSGICVIAYDLKPPVDAKDWIKWVNEGWEKENLRRLEARGENRIED